MLRGLALAGDGTVTRQEIYGTPSFDEWSRSYRVLSTALIMLGAVSPNRLQQHSDHIGQYIQRFGDRVLAIVYQGDVRNRLEHMQLLRRRAIEERPLTYDADHLWEHVWGCCLQNHAFWKREVEDPALLIAARAFDLDDMLDGDAPVGRSSTHARAVEALTKKRKPEDDRQSGQSKRPKVRRNHHNVSDGKLYTNRRGRLMCAGFQDNTCTSTLPGTSICAADKKSAHQCSMCLGLDHGASQCRVGLVAPPPARRRYEAAKGAGKRGKGHRG